MLAERRQKTKWSTNLCGNLWTKDSNKFGQKILEKFGWTPGKGLGVSEQGIVNPVRLKCNSTQKGLGYDRKNSVVIFQHQEEFDSILSGLNTSDVTKDAKDAPRSLEEKSKQCKTRVHYHKFTRGKDLSRYSEKDLSCILGAVPSFKESVVGNETISETISFSTSEICSVSSVEDEQSEDQAKDLFLSKHGKKSKQKRKRKLESDDHNAINNGLVLDENECRNQRVDFKSDIDTNCEVDEEPVSKQKRSKKGKKIEEITQHFLNNKDALSLEMSEDVVNKKKKKFKKKHKTINKGE